MKDKFFFDLGRIMDEVFDVAQDFSNAFKDACHTKGQQWNWDESVDYYPAYAYPPANVYLREDRTLIFEFALSGFEKQGLHLRFQGDYMILSAAAPVGDDVYKDVHFFKRRLKMKEITDQKYYVPASKFNRDNVSAIFKNGLLKISIPPKEKVSEDEGIKVEINEEEDS